MNTIENVKFPVMWPCFCNILKRDLLYALVGYDLVYIKFIVC